MAGMTLSALRTALKQRLGLGKQGEIVQPVTYPMVLDGDTTDMTDEQDQAVLERARLIYLAWRGGAAAPDVQLGTFIDQAIAPKDGGTNAAQ